VLGRKEVKDLVGSKYFGRAMALGPPRTLLVAGMLASCVAAFAFATSAAAAVSRPLLAHATRVGDAPAAQSLPLIFPLKVDAASLARFSTSVSTPGSPLYGQYLSVAALSRRFGASASTRARALRYLRTSGATDVRIDATGTLAEANMRVGLAERIFAAPMARFETANRTRFVAPASATTLPAPLRGVVEGVVGLDTQPDAAPSLDSSKNLARASGATSPPATSSTLARTGAPTGCAAGVAAGGQYPGFTPNQYLTAYGFNTLQAAGDDGQGERVALIEIDGFSPVDVQTFAQCFGLHLPPVSAFGAGGVTNPLPPGEEATLDIEILDAAAPDLKAIDVYETNAGAEQTLSAFAAPLENKGRKPQVISASLGLCESDAYTASGLAGIEASEHLLELAAASGVSVLASSGDNGSADCTSNSGAPVDELAVNYPASSWWVTGVGGTNLNLNAGNAITTQPVWNDANLLPAGGGGGFSGLFRRPSWQNGVVAEDERAVPDVAMLADLLPGYAIYCTAQPDCISSTSTNPWQTVGGTSAPTPLLAGGVAIVDQMLKAAHRENLGLLNPLLYELGKSSAAASVFNDVTTGSNDIGPFIPGGNGQNLGCCTATPGYDEASGWGSVQLAGLAQQALTLVPKTIKVSVKVPGGQRPVAHHELQAKVSCSAACAIGAFASVKIGKSKPYTVESKLFHRKSKGSTTIPVKFSSKELRTLRSALTDHKKVVATVYGALIDSLGDIEQNTGGKKLTIKS
jgi:subtilase family serine protease